MVWPDKFANSQLRAGLKDMASELRELVWRRFQEGFDGVLSGETVADFIKHGGIEKEQLMRELVKVAMTFSRAPYSEFNVGAVVEGVSGNLYFGTNVEWPKLGFSRSVHAEVAALVCAWLEGEKGVLSIAINGMPCGHCRQFLREFGSFGPRKVLFTDGTESSLDVLLPQSFGPEDLGIKSSPFDSQLNLSFVNAADGFDPKAKKALDIAKRSYCPYSKAPAGIVLSLASGDTVQAAVFENAAFNPTIMPLEAAIVRHIMSGGVVADIIQIDLACQQGADLVLDYKKEADFISDSLDLPEAAVWALKFD